MSYSCTTRSPSYSCDLHETLYTVSPLISSFKQADHCKGVLRTSKKLTEISGWSSSPEILVSSARPPRMSIPCFLSVGCEKDQHTFSSLQEGFLVESETVDRDHTMNVLEQKAYESTNLHQYLFPSVFIKRWIFLSYIRKFSETVVCFEDFSNEEQFKNIRGSLGNIPLHG